MLCQKCSSLNLSIVLLHSLRSNGGVLIRAQWCNYMLRLLLFMHDSQRGTAISSVRALNSDLSLPTTGDGRHNFTCFEHFSDTRMQTLFELRLGPSSVEHTNNLIIHCRI
jgi:hypothetical protein